MAKFYHFKKTKKTLTNILGNKIFAIKKQKTCIMIKCQNDLAEMAKT